MLMTTLSDIGERELIKRIRGLCSGNDGVISGIGDDCAVVCPPTDGNDLVLTSDALIEGVHFLPTTPAGDIGHKVVARTVSDLAASGAEPLWLLINLVATPQSQVEQLEEILSAANRTATKHNLAIVGGDTSSGQCLELHAFAVGQVPHGRAILRSGARTDDLICVTGNLGGSAAGAHLTFEPRIAEGVWLRNGGWATSMIDISDGLAVDLRHLTEESQTGASLVEGGIPVSLAAQEADDGRSGIEHALHDGEDYELLFTVPPEKKADLQLQWSKQFDTDLSFIGTMTAAAGTVECTAADGQSRDLRADGYEHFRPIDKE